MDLAAILVKIAGLTLFLFTARSIYKHFKTKMARKKVLAATVPAGQGQPAPGSKPEQSKIEHALNAFLLYAWFIFMTALSLGMIINN